MCILIRSGIKQKALLEPTDFFLRGLTIWDQASSGCFRENIRYDSLWAEEKRWHLPWMPSQELATSTAVAIFSASRWSSVKVQGSLSSLLRFAVITSSNLPHLREIVARRFPSHLIAHIHYKVKVKEQASISSLPSSKIQDLTHWHNFSLRHYRLKSTTFLWVV